MNFSKTTSYSLKVMDFMARHEGSRMSASYLNKKLKIPYSYLRQVLGELSRNGFIESTKGRTGGFTLSKATKDIFLSDIVKSIEGLQSFDRCIMGFSKCPFKNPCPLHETWTNARNEITGILKNTSLHDLLGIKTVTN
jgi:Rrf2 family transcriptional regulator, iron-sulfur cluster assembly transcription factor